MVTFDSDLFGSRERETDDALFRSLSKARNESKSRRFIFNFSSSLLLKAAESAARRKKIQLEKIDDLFQVNLATPREDHYVRNLLIKNHEPYVSLKKERALSMQQFLLDTGNCAMQHISSYFGQQSEACGICDYCNPQTPSEVDLLTFCSTPRSISDCLSKFECTPQELIKSLESLVEDQSLALNAEGKFYTL